LPLLPSFNPRAVGLSLPAAEAIDIAASAGFAAVDLMVRDLVAVGDRPADLRRRMDDYGLKGGAFPLPVSWRGDEDTFLRDLADLPRQAEAAAVLGLTRTGTWVMPELPEGMGREQTIQLHLTRLGGITETLDQFGIRIGLETIGVASFRKGVTPLLFTRQGDLGPLLNPLAAHHKNVGLLLDSFHLYAADESLGSALAQGIDSLVWVHVADLPPGSDSERSRIEDHNRGLPGEHGAVYNRAILAVLADRGYDGPVTAEPLARCRSLNGLDPLATARAVAHALRSVWPEGFPFGPTG
jgi:sugar phosphate isomerase/epimerase